MPDQEEDNHKMYWSVGNPTHNELLYTNFLFDMSENEKIHSKI